MKSYNVVAAVIIKDLDILCTQRSKSKYDYISEKWEFPGGKIENGETEQNALVREIREELNLDIEVGRKIIVVEHSYPDFSITMHTFLCNTSNQNLILNEHLSFKWLPKHNLLNLDWAAADIPIVHRILEIQDL